MTGATATTHAARDHARAQAGVQVAEQRTIPATAATDLPDGVDPSTVLWDELVEGGNYASRLLPRGARLRLTDVDGDACVQLLLHNALQPAERLNVADTVKVQWSAYLGQGQLLLSDMGRTMAAIVRDTSAGHDTFCGASNEAANERRYGSGGVHDPCPNARERFSVALTKWGLGRRDIMPTVNLFKPVRVEPDGSFTWHGDRAPAGGVVELRCDLDVLVVLTNTPHVLDPRPTYTVSPVRITAWTGPPAGPDDPLRLATPEAQRAYENTDDFYLGRPAGAVLGGIR